MFRVITTDEMRAINIKRMYEIREKRREKMNNIGLKITFHINDETIGDEYNMTRTFRNRFEMSSFILDYRMKGIKVKILATEYCDF